MSRKNNKKAYFFTLDALFALVILLAVIVLIPFTHISSVPEKYRTSFLQEDMLRLLSTLKTKEINNSAIDGNISALNLSVKEMLDDEDKFLDTLTKIWASSESYAENMEILKNMTEAFFGEVFDARDNIGLFFEKDGTLEEIFLRNTTSHMTAKDITTAKKFVTGVQYGKPLGGYSARAFTYKTERVKYVYFGGYVGDGNITQKFELPLGANVTDLTIEIAIFGSSFNIKINGNVTSNSPVMPASDAFTPIKVSNFIQEELSWLHEGENEISFESTTNDSLYIAGGFIRITYKTTQGYASKPKRYLPFIKGTMNLYDSLFAPGNITSLAIHLEYEQQANTTPFVRIANVTVWRDERENRTGYNSVTITNETIFNVLKQAGLGYENISRVTVPIRIGLEEIAQNISGGNADVVVITDVSGSMRWMMSKDQVIGNNISADQCGNLSDPNNPVFDPSTNRISVVRCLNIDFINAILNVPGNRVGLVAFTGSPSSVPSAPVNTIWSSYNLTNDTAALISNISAYSPQNATGICGGIRKARIMLQEQSNASRKQFILVMTDGLANVQCNETDINRTDGGCIGDYCPNTNYCNAQGCGSGCSYRVAENVGARSKPALAFNLSGNNKWIMISGNGDGTFKGYFWDGTRWITNSSLVNGLPDIGSDSAPYFVFNLTGNSLWGLIVGKSDGTFVGFSWIGTSWVNDNSLVSGLLDIGSNAEPALVFNLTGDNKWILISGKSDGTFSGFYWNGTQWIQNNSLAPDSDIGTYSAPTIGFNITGSNKFELISGSGGSAFYGFIWNGSQWISNNSISNGLTLGTGQGSGSPDVAYNLIENKWYLISGQSSGSQGFYSFYWNDEAKEWLMVCGDVVNDRALEQAINETTRAFNALPDLKVYAVGFGPIEFCPIANYTLARIAEEGNGSYYLSRNASLLRNKFREWAEEILRLSYANQTIVVVGNASSNLTNGYIEMDFERDEYYERFGDLGYLGGEQSDQVQGSIFGDFITYETQGFSNGMVNFSFQHGTPYEAVIVSYSGPVWTKFASINNTTAEYEIYNLTRWSNVYTFLGDPFRVNIPPEYIARNGTTNTVSLLLGANASSSQNPTSSSKIIYTLVIPPLFSYSTPQPKKEGCNWTIEYEEPAGSGFSGGNFSVLVPPTYSGEKKCFYTNSTIRYYDDAYDVAVFNLLSNSLDVNPHNGMVEIKLGAEVSINAIILPGVPFMQYTSIKAMSWR